MQISGKKGFSNNEGTTCSEKATMRNGNGMTPVASNIGTTGIMVTIYVYRDCGKMMKSVKTVNKRRLKRIRTKETMSTYSNGNMRKL
jgi:hypothetical protein